MNTFNTSSSMMPQLYHPILTNVVYRSASQPSCGLTYGDVPLTRGTRGFIEYAQLRGYLPKPTTANQDGGAATSLATKKLSALEHTPTDVLLQIVGYMDPHTRAQFFQVSRPLHNLKEASLRGRDDLIKKLLEYVRGDLSLLPYQDREVVQEIGRSIRSLNFADLSFNRRMLELPARIFPSVQELDVSRCEIPEECLAKLELLKPFPHLKRLNLVLPTVCNVDGLLELVGNFSELEFLSLTNPTGMRRLDKEDLQKLGQKLQGLQSLILTGFMLYQGDGFGLTPFKNLSQLHVDPRDWYGNYADSSFEELGKLTKLRDLKIRNFAKNDDLKPLEYLANLKQLEKLTITEHFTQDTSPENFKTFLKSFPCLTDLSIELYRFPRKSPFRFTLLEDIALSCPTLKRLTVLFLDGCYTGFDELAKLPELEYLELRNAKSLSRTILLSLDQFPKLQKIVIDKCENIYTYCVEKARLSKKKMPEIDFTPVEDEGYETVSDNDNDSDIETDDN